MGRRKRKFTFSEKAAKRRRRLEYMTIFVNGKQKRVKRPPTIEGLPVDEFIRRNADPVWLFQNEMHEELYAAGSREGEEVSNTRSAEYDANDPDDIPF